MVLSLGNSRLAIGVFVAGNLEYVRRLPIAEKQNWQGALSEAWGRIASTESPAVAGASVNPAQMEALEHLVQQVSGKAVEWVGQEIDIPIKVQTEPPEQTGIDRVLSMAAAYEQMGKACVVVDAGTAITVNLCNDEGAFLGGAIAPGAAMMLDALHEKTARLPRVELAVPEGPVGKSTQQSILHGVYHGLRGLVKELVENYATELGYWPDVIATGGDAEKLFENWEMIHAIAPDLLLYGVALAYAEHHSK